MGVGLSRPAEILRFGGTSGAEGEQAAKLPRTNPLLNVDTIVRGAQRDPASTDVLYHELAGQQQFAANTSRTSRRSNV